MMTRATTRTQRFLDAVCGIGKTYEIIQQAIERAARKGQNTVIVQPTKELIDKTVDLLTQQLQERHDGSNGIEYKVFHSDLFPGAVAKEMVEWFKVFGSNCGQIVFCTHQVLPHIPRFPNKHNFDAVIDEALQVHDQHVLRLPHTHSLLTAHLELEDYNAIFSRLVCKNAKAVTAIAKNVDKDAIYEVLSQAARDVQNKYWDCFVNTERFKRLLRGEIAELEIYTILSPRILDDFRSVFIASANFHHTPLFHLWQQQGIEFVEDTAFKSALQARHDDLIGQHSNGDHLTIYYALERPWSRRRQVEKIDGGDNTLLHYIAAAAAEFLRDKGPYVWQANKSDSEALKPLFGTNQQLPHLAFGLNDYSHINNVLLLTASTPPPDHYRFLRNQGMDATQVRQAIYFQNGYQTVLRSSVRRNDDSAPRIAIVPDRALADYLQALFPRSTVAKLPNVDAIREDADCVRRTLGGRPKKYGDDHEQRQKRREQQTQWKRQKKLELLREVLLLNQRTNRPYVTTDVLEGELEAINNVGIDIVPFDPTWSTKTLLDTYRVSVDHVQPYGTLFASKHTPTGPCIIGTDDDAYIRWLQHLWQRRLNSKADNQLVGPVFDPTRDADKDRGLNNIVYLRHLWLDFEDGELPPDELPKLFPNVRMVVTNSFNHSSDTPRFHVLIPLKRPLTADAYVALWDLVAEKIEDAGYSVGPSSKDSKKAMKKSGLDTSKRPPTSLFYLPCQSIHDGAHGFFVDYNDADRAVLDAELWLRNSVIDRDDYDDRCAAPTTADTIDAAKVAAATMLWRQSTLFPEEGNDRFWHFGVALRSAGMQPQQIRTTLTAEAAHGRSPKQRHAQIKSIMDNLFVESTRVAEGLRSEAKQSVRDIVACW